MFLQDLWQSEVTTGFFDGVKLANHSHITSLLKTTRQWVLSE